MTTMLNPNAIPKGSITQEMIDASVLDVKQDVIDDLDTIREGANTGNEAFEIITSMVNAGYLFGGIATPVTDPKTPDAKVFYIANGKGTYTHFDNIDVTEDDVVVLYYDTAWHKVATGIASQEKLTELESVIKGDKWTQRLEVVDYLNTKATEEMLEVDIQKNDKIDILLTAPLNNEVTVFFYNSLKESVQSAFVNSGIVQTITAVNDIKYISLYKDRADVKQETIELIVHVQEGILSDLSDIKDSISNINNNIDDVDDFASFNGLKYENAYLNESVNIDSYLNQYNSTFPVDIKKGNAFRVFLFAPKNKEVNIYFYSNGDNKIFRTLSTNNFVDVVTDYDLDSISLYRENPLKEKIRLFIVSKNEIEKLSPKNTNYDFKDITGWSVSNRCNLSIGGMFIGYHSDRYPQLVLTGIPVNTGVMKVYVNATIEKIYVDKLNLAIRGYDSGDNNVLYADIEDVQEGQVINYLAEGSTGNKSDILSLYIQCANSVHTDGAHICDIKFNYVACFDEYEINTPLIAYSICTTKYKYKLINRPNTQNRVWCAIGDSLTDQATYIAPTIDGLSLVKCVRISQGGKRISGSSESNPSMCEDVILNQIPSDAWLITILGGTNDWAQSVQIGENTSEDTSTFKGAINRIITKISTDYPNARLVFMGMPYGELPAKVENGEWANAYTNTLGFTPYDYANATQEVCRMRGIPCVNLCQMTGWNHQNISSFIKYDGGLVHPLDAGGKRIASVLCGFVKSMMPISIEDI